MMIIINKKKSLLILFSLVTLNSISQTFDDQKTVLTNFIKRMYVITPFEGVKILEDYDNQYLISVVKLEDSKYANESVKTRVAQVKAQSQANTYINGSNISMDIIISTKELLNEKNEVSSSTETIEYIKENSMGFSQGLELFSLFKTDENKNTIYIYGRKIK
jgi:hypothetical protein